MNQSPATEICEIDQTGFVTIPDRILMESGIDRGDKVRVSVGANGAVVVEKRRSLLARLRGAFSS